MDWETVKILLLSNSKEEIEEAVRVLTKIGENIVKNPNLPKIRTLQKTNATISQKILKLNGGLECLKLMGFQEDASSFTMPFNSSMAKLATINNDLRKLKENLDNEMKGYVEMINKSADSSPDKKISEPNKIEKKIVQEPVFKMFTPPPFTHKFTNPFLRYIETRFNFALAYDDQETLNHAKTLIPIDRLEKEAQENMRDLQKEIKNKRVRDLDVSIQDLLIIELLHWFKNEFFTWVDSPDCSFCGGTTKFAYMSTDPNLLVYTQRVEMHRCSSCEQFTPFARYTDLNILLETRRGRCGEWASTFTLLCRAMGWDARFIEAIDGDHVWTEVFSFSQKRWLHCDPCEDVCDRPLLYENGWGKKITYVLAFSGEEVQDVTWRYTSNHREVIHSRKKCCEQELIECLLTLRADRQKNISPARKEYLRKRIIFELIELMRERKPSEEDNQGRTSGGVEWKLARNETRCFVPFTWQLDQNTNKLTLKYSLTSDNYELTDNTKTILSKKGWISGVYHIENIFKKEEKDWRQVYLCRTEGADVGTITWNFNCDKVIDSISLKLDSTVFQSGKVILEVSTETQTFLVPEGQKTFAVNFPEATKSLKITAKLSGGEGEHRWQHAQLFRQPMDDNNAEYPFLVEINLKT